ncbi:UNVERIFIED_CONTAM: hypothetical protein Slati_3682200 [Sesamum latifolium]|uniref:Uncharacterized protein n=1 Tax=Sesamum latifolium TaxID=2727402 RepID=A0AAW2U363_9LAMI
MTMNTIPFTLRGKLNDTSGKKKDAPQERWPRKLTLKEMQTKQFPFLDSDVSGIFDDLLNANLIELPEMKRPEEAGKTDDPKYCNSSTWHQCFKYSRDGIVKKVLADDKPFTEAESRFTDSKYYLGSTKTKQDSSTEKPEQQINQDEGKTTFSAGGSENRPKEKTPLKGFDSLKELVLPLTNIDARKPQPLKGFVRPTQGPEKEHEEPSKLQTTKGFDPKAYKLLVKPGYNPQERDAFGKTLSRG